MNIEEGEYAIQTPNGIFDIFFISKDKNEVEVLSAIKESLLKEKKFGRPGPNKICMASIAAFIIYMSSISDILEADTNEHMN